MADSPDQPPPDRPAPPVDALRGRPDAPGAPQAQAAISGSAIIDSTINQTIQVTQQAHPWQPRWEPAPAEAQVLLDAMPLGRVPEISPLPGGSRMPFPPNPHFVGRDPALLALAAALQSGGQVAIGPKAAATGMGGIGKTSVAAEFVHRYGAYFAGGVFWLDFADPAAIPGEIAACGGPGLLDLHPSYGALKQAEQVALVRQAWQRPIPRLLIFDNCEAPELVRDWAPASGGCRVLITSRRHAWPRSLRIAARRLDELERAASVALLRDLAPRLTDAEADALAEELGDLPLALQLAGSYLAQFGRISAEAYLAELRSDVILAHPSLRGLHDGDVSLTAHDRHVGRTFLVSRQRLDPARDGLAVALLARAACLAPGAPIPEELLLASAGLAAEAPAGQAALGRLADLGFVTIGDQGAALHRLVHAFVGGVARDGAALAEAEQALIDRAWRVNAAGYPAAMQPLLPHLRWATRQQAAREDPVMATLCTQLGASLQAAGSYAAARPLYERALAIRERALGPDHHATASSLHNLAALLRATGDLAAAQPLYERALAGFEQAFGPDHPATAQSLHNLAELLRARGELAAARELAERGLRIAEEQLGPTHPDTATHLNNVAEILRAEGDAGAALALYERALAISEQRGPLHPDTASVLYNLAGLLRETGDHQAARLRFERALRIREQTLGPLHPDTVRSLDSLAPPPNPAGADGLAAEASAIRPPAPSDLIE